MTRTDPEDERRDIDRPEDRRVHIGLPDAGLDLIGPGAGAGRHQTRQHTHQQKIGPVGRQQGRQEVLIDPWHLFPLSLLVFHLRMSFILSVFSAALFLM